MDISRDTRNIIDFLDQYTQGSLRKKNDLAAIIELGAAYSEPEFINKLIFAGKSLWNLSKSLKRARGEEEGLRLIQKEFEHHLEDVRSIIKELAEYSDKDDRRRFDEIYLVMTKGAVLNIIDLCHDLARLKDLQGDVRRQ